MLEDNLKNQWDFWIDRGGTFTDVVAKSPSGSLFTKKILSENPKIYKDAGMACIKMFLGLKNKSRIPVKLIRSIKMGTTVATNALLERKGSPVVLLTTKGLADQLRIAYQNRPNLFDRHIEISAPLYNEIIEVEERVDSSGKILIPLNEKKTFKRYPEDKKSKGKILRHSIYA